MTTEQRLKVRSIKRSVESFTDYELRDALQLSMCSISYEHACNGNCKDTVGDAVRELWRRYEELKGEVLARSQNL